jgi:Cof subfamily protein (haloacid dehalogenase superfamily)
LQRIVDALAITAPIGAFNGGVLLTPNMEPIEQHLLSDAIARHAFGELAARGLEVWVFSGDEWYVRDAASAYVAREIHALQFAPIVVSEFAPVLKGVAKVVGLSGDLDLVARCEKEIGRTLASGAAVVRSQVYALDITHPLANKGAALGKIAERMATPLSAIAVIGDGGNDLAMFALSGFSVAMGNAASDLKDAANYVTASNDNDGFAQAVDDLFVRKPSPASNS